MSDCYKPRRAYELDIENEKIVGRFKFIIAGEMADGTKCWYKCDDDGNITDYNKWYSFSRIARKTIAILEGIN